MSTRDQCDRAFSLLVRARAGWCENCGRTGSLDGTFLRTGGLECAHIISRRNGQVRCDPDNALALCHACHRHYTARPLEWLRFARRRLGDARWTALLARARRTDRIDWDAVLVDLNSQLRRLRKAA